MQVLRLREFEITNCLIFLPGFLFKFQYVDSYNKHFDFFNQIEISDSTFVIVF